MAKSKKTFEEWFKEVDQHVQKAVIISVHELPDCPYHDWYDDGVRPATAAKRAIKNSFD